MANNYFAFKQFVVHQDHCAMKVGTDGVLLGAWASVFSARKALDIGTGTGLVALMLAQRNPELYVTAIDIDTNAIKQAEENVNNSPFPDRIVCENISLAEYVSSTSGKFDLIVSNPPYFSASLKSPDFRRSTARHTDTLSVGELMISVSELLSETGRFFMIYPHERKNELIDLASKNGLYVDRLTNVYPTSKSPPKRILAGLSKIEGILEETNLVIEKERHIYSPEFYDLVKDFYLML